MIAENTSRVWTRLKGGKPARLLTFAVLAWAALALPGAPSAHAATVTLYDQLNNPSSIATVSQAFESSFAGFNAFTADDFVVPAGGWTINQVDAQGQYFNGPGPAASFNVFFYANSGTLPGTLVYGTTGATYTQAGSVFSVVLPVAANLPAGTYWVSVQARMDYSPRGEWGWTNRTVQANNPAAWQNPNNGFETGCSTWGRRTSCVGDATSPDQSFRLLESTKASPTIATTASAGNLLGAPVHDTATVSGGSSPGGTVTFRLFSDAACATQVFTSTNPLGAGTATSDNFTPAAAGTYYWIASYSGDAGNNAVAAPCGDANESVVIAPFTPPSFTRTITGDFSGPVTVNAGDSVLITNARVVGPVTVNPGGALTVVNSQISRGIVANGPSFFSVCGSQVSGPSTTPGRGIVVYNAGVPIRIGDPANGCAANRVAGDVSLTTNTAGLTLGANTVSGNVTANNNGPGNTIIKANNIYKTLGCVGNNPPPINAGQVNTAASKSGQCSTL